MCLCIRVNLNLRLSLLTMFSIINPRIMSSRHYKAVNNICILDMGKLRLRS